jgi:hypothetical protein
MNRHELPDSIAPADFSFRDFSGELQILRRQTNRDKGEDLRLVANASPTVDDTMAMDLHTFAQDDVIANYRKRTNAATRSDPGVGTNDCRGMDLH